MGKFVISFNPSKVAPTQQAHELNRIEKVLDSFGEWFSHGMYFYLLKTSSSHEEISSQLLTVTNKNTSLLVMKFTAPISTNVSLRDAKWIKFNIL